MSRSLAVLRVATLVGYFGLLLLVVLWQAWLAPSERIPRSILLLLFGGPLLLPLRGLLAGRPYTHAWTSFLALFYFLHGVGEAYGNPAERGLGLAEVVLSLIFFFGAVFFARQSSRLGRQGGSGGRTVGPPGNGTTAKPQ